MMTDDLIKVNLNLNLGLLYRTVNDQFGCNPGSRCAKEKVKTIVSEFLENWVGCKEEHIQYKTIGTKHISIFLEFMPPERNLGEHPIIVGTEIIPCKITVED